MKRDGRLILYTGVLILLIIPLVSAGFLDDLWDNVKGRITGQVTNTTNVSISVSGTNPVTVGVRNATMVSTDVDPTTNTLTRIKFFVVVTDTDGQGDINTSSVNASVAYKQQGFYNTNRTNSSYGCIDKGNIDSTSRNFSCSIDMWFFDPPGIWNITVYARDTGATTNVRNISQTFNYDSLQSTLINPQSMTFPSASIGALNVTSNNDPLFINNTGNFNFTSIQVNSTDLPGQTTTTEFINASNFSVGVTSVGSGAEEEECGNSVTTTDVNDTILAPQVYKLLDIANLTRGNYSAAANKNVTGQEGLFFCIRQVSTDISSQTYATTSTSPWTIQLT